MKLLIIVDDNNVLGLYQDINTVIKISVSRHGDFFSLGGFEIVISTGYFLSRY